MVREISSELKAEAIEKLNEIPERIQQDINNIREWLKKQPHLCVRDDDQSLLSFLRGCKHSLQITKNKLDFFYTAKTLVPEFYGGRDPFLPEIQAILNAGFLCVLPQADDHGAKILLWNMSECNPDTMPYVTLVKVCTMLIDILLNEDDNAIIFGLNIWIDLKNCPIKYGSQFSPSFVKKHLEITEKGLPLRIKGLHITNCHPLLEFAYYFSKSLCNGKVTKRMHLYQDYNKFHSVIPQRLLPEEYGGNNGSLKNLKNVWKEKIESYREWFLQDSKYKSNENLRPGKQKTMSDMFGIEGSFRKLTVD
ncbi:hypothetical protein RN001_008070 [Aquatica leii]|uniref:CRAL-TRIO domain-containing protein n=1 Tax=Aquatica leii TaxID=1421715 RepID=A0AAN7P9U7_9COLE|nr:hypothetical protein RN001_008070 [Aquatica leii]